MRGWPVSVIYISVAKELTQDNQEQIQLHVVCTICSKMEDLNIFS